jgi:hypothetical protein
MPAVLKLASEFAKELPYVKNSSARDSSSWEIIAKARRAAMFMARFLRVFPP